MAGKPLIHDLTRNQIVWLEVQRQPGARIGLLHAKIAAHGITIHQLEHTLRYLLQTGRVRRDNSRWKYRYWVIGSTLPPNGNRNRKDNPQTVGGQEKTDENTKRGRGASKITPPPIPSLLELLARI